MLRASGASKWTTDIALMPLLSLLATIAIQNDKPIELSRKFRLNEKFAYKVSSSITAEQRQQGLLTWLPEDFSLEYGFTYTVKSLKGDGIAVVDYARPSMTEIEGETGTSAPKSTVEKMNWILLINLSPINELLEVKDLTPKKPEPKKTKNKLRTVAPRPQSLGPLAPFVGEMHRLALFAGNLDSGLDLAPKLPLENVKVGDTWKRTVGYQPQKLKNKEGKSVVQRLDYTYTYLGQKTVDGKQILRVQAKLDFKTDLADYVKTLLEGTNLRSGLKTWPLTLKTSIDFDLDPVTRHTILAQATSEGGFSAILDGESDAMLEERFKGRTTMELVGRKIVPPTKK